LGNYNGKKSFDSNSVTMDVRIDDRGNSHTRAKARAEEALRLLKQLRHAATSVRDHGHGSAAETADGLPLGWFGVSSIYGSTSVTATAADCAANARMFAAAPALLEQLAADVLSLVEQAERGPTKETP
jgi:hypothetical protein